MKYARKGGKQCRSTSRHVPLMKRKQLTQRKAAGITCDVHLCIDTMHAPHASSDGGDYKEPRTGVPGESGTVHTIYNIYNKYVK